MALNIKKLIGKQPAKLIQSVRLNVLAGDTIEVGLYPSRPNHDVIVQCYKFEPGVDDVVGVIKDFNNADKANFYYDEDSVVFDGTMRQKTTFNYPLTEVGDVGIGKMFMSEEIDKTKFKKVGSVSII